MNSEAFEPRFQRIWKCTRADLKSINLHLINKTLWNVPKYGTQTCNRNSKDDYEVKEFKREKLEKM